MEEWKGTRFKFDAVRAPHPLTAKDLHHLRAKGLGFGEISILLALTARQAEPRTAKPLSEIVAMRQAGEGWGKIAHDLGCDHPGFVIEAVRAIADDASRP